MLVKEPSLGGQGGQAEHCRMLFGRGEVRAGKTCKQSAGWN